jgi:hypothetical protein
MKSDDLVTVATTGGLGNQLFQVAAALSFAKMKPILLDRNLLLNNNLDIFDFVDPTLIRVVDEKAMKKFYRKIGNAVLRSTRGVKSTNPLDWSPRLTRFCGASILSLIYPFGSKVSAPNNLGFDASHKLMRGRNLLIGYFQSYKWFEGINLSEVFKLQQRCYSNEFESLLAAAREIKPVVLHVRLGDYAQSLDLQEISPNYYRNAISTLGEFVSNSEVWVFSNEVERAKAFLPNELDLVYKFIPSDLLTPSQNLELMRYGSAYIIGNSTFSWWSAYLRYDDLAPVCYPAIWFTQMDTPHMMHPKVWEAVKP